MQPTVTRPADPCIEFSGYWRLAGRLRLGSAWTFRKRYVSFLGKDSSVSAASLSVPKTWDEITPEWMSAALAADYPGVVVDGVSVELRDDGTNRRARLGVTYQAGSGPASVFVKAADPAHKAMIRLTSGMFHEPRLFTCGVDLPLEHPAVHAALIDEADYDFVMVMEDLGRGEPIRATAPDRTQSRRSPPGCVAWPGCTAGSGVTVCCVNPPSDGWSRSCRGAAWRQRRYRWPWNASANRRPPK